MHGRNLYLQSTFRKIMSPISASGIILIVLVTHGLHCEGTSARRFRRQVIFSVCSSPHTHRECVNPDGVVNQTFRYDSQDPHLDNYLAFTRRLQSANNIFSNGFTFSGIVSASSYGLERTQKPRTRTSSPFRKLPPAFGILTSDPAGR